MGVSIRVTVHSLYYLLYFSCKLTKSSVSADALIAVEVDPERIADNEDDAVNPDDPPAADTADQVAPKKKVVRNPQPKLNAER